MRRLIDFWVQGSKLKYHILFWSTLRRKLALLNSRSSPGVSEAAFKKAKLGFVQQQEKEETSRKKTF